LFAQVLKEIKKKRKRAIKFIVSWLTVSHRPLSGATFVARQLEKKKTNATQEKNLCKCEDSGDTSPID
jgi:hypothetical protein